ncbi:substrate-binding domain-containing protein [Metabacillus sp. Hm71]|uniref:substrate-binding domain-containing protein n=1 Tax=Metabacillus sp. Hm71 TaxID=3450743 RepID=UPI003F42B655
MERLPKKPTAWFCVNDGFGFLVSSYLQQSGFKIPEQVSVCNFDNGQLSQLSTPKITTMDIDLKLYGKKAVDRLIWRISNKDAVCQEILLPTTLINRASTGPAPTN